ncbi:MAG TPA: SDR family oxidoreductase, partial [Polyangia bacterium]|nr:SDR family oxidoreductase [Polyangia bacterium]
FGRALAERFASRGWRVFASMRDPSRGEALRALAVAKGWRLTTPPLDVTETASVQAAVGDLLRDTAGRLDVLVNNAGYYAYGPLEETTSDELRAQLETNVIGVHRVTRAVLPAMRARGDGAVVTIGSVSGRVALPIVGPYHASKWALEGMIESWRLELAPFGIRVSLVEPGMFATALYANERFAAAFTPQSPYAGLVEAYRRQSAALGRAEDLTPVVDAVERAATTANPRLRWPVGPSSFSGTRLRPLVPDRLYEWLIRLAFRTRPRPVAADPDPAGTSRRLQL